MHPVSTGIAKYGRVHHTEDHRYVPYDWEHRDQSGMTLCPARKHQALQGASKDGEGRSRAPANIGRRAARAKRCGRRDRGVGGDRNAHFPYCKPSYLRWVFPPGRLCDRKHSSASDSTSRRPLRNLTELSPQVCELLLGHDPERVLALRPGHAPGPDNPTARPRMARGPG